MNPGAISATDFLLKYCSINEFLMESLIIDGESGFYWRESLLSREGLCRHCPDRWAHTHKHLDRWILERAMALEFAPGKTRIGWIGTGVMGRSMCGHLMAAGYQATIYNRTVEKTKALAEKGAVVADSVTAVTTSADVVFTILG